MLIASYLLSCFILMNAFKVIIIFPILYLRSWVLQVNGGAKSYTPHIFERVYVCVHMCIEFKIYFIAYAPVVQVNKSINKIKPFILLLSHSFLDIWRHGRATNLSYSSISFYLDGYEAVIETKVSKEINKGFKRAWCQWRESPLFHRSWRCNWCYSNSKLLQWPFLHCWQRCKHKEKQ